MIVNFAMRKIIRADQGGLSEVQFNTDVTNAK
jgi:hypothetical protein